jgi:hypothetical protein
MQESSPAKGDLFRNNSWRSKNSVQDQILLTILLLFAASPIPASSQSASAHTSMRHPHPMSKRHLTVREISIVDEAGRVCMTLSATKGAPSIHFFGPDGKERMTASLDSSGYGSIQIANPSVSSPVASLAVDDKGAHVKFDRLGGASSYLFLNNAGESGTVFLDSKGKRSLEILVTSSGETEIHRYDQPARSQP